MSEKINGTVEKGLRLKYCDLRMGNMGYRGERRKQFEFGAGDGQSCGRVGRKEKLKRQCR